MTLFIIFSLIIALSTIGVIGGPLAMAGGARKDGSRAKRMRLVALGALGLTPVMAAFIYAKIGAPAALDPAMRETPTNPAAQIAALPADERAVMIEGMVEGLAARLEADPQDLGGWRMLARSTSVLGRHDDAVNAWREALALSGGVVDDWRGLAMALIETRDPDAAPAIKEAFEEVLLQEPEDPLALYFLGQAALNNGDDAWAIELLTRLRAQTPDEAPLANELDHVLSALEAATVSESNGPESTETEGEPGE